MPTFVTREIFSCRHIWETCRRTVSLGGNSGNESRVITDTIPNTRRCLSCACDAALLVFSPFLTVEENDDEVKEDLRKVSPSPEALSLVGELAALLGTMLADKRQQPPTRLTVGVVEKLTDMRRRIVAPSDVGEFRGALFDVVRWSQVQMKLNKAWNRRHDLQQLSREAGGRFVIVRPYTSFIRSNNKRQRVA
ncbi:hypothetical protein GGR53DRAFT_466157 [Hypoxylon sp. FL1150]|nr:hypothetical protein GGR53DRAFT_466157 [Hypoxylon sp. FL1150]